MPTIAIIGTLDTKGEEFRFLKEEVERRGARALVIHAGILGEPLFAPDVGADEVARAGGESLAALRTRGYAYERLDQLTMELLLGVR